ncbi:MAG: hypothetical protein AAGG81_02690 [Chlamydiota bacterium]
MDILEEIIAENNGRHRWDANMAGKRRKKTLNMLQSIPSIRNPYRNDEIRYSRLQERGQPELANQTMMNCVNRLRNEALPNKLFILDNGVFSLQQSTSRLLTLIVNHEAI